MQRRAVAQKFHRCTILEALKSSAAASCRWACEIIRCNSITAQQAVEIPQKQKSFLWDFNFVGENFRNFIPPLQS
ncbi:hypothetical protein DCC62_06205 [candidate division KSB1 bacterium]|nr:MAG: hypothetical protein DCC62_06205 [candidate division KSB1 bacterium]